MQLQSVLVALAASSVSAAYYNPPHAHHNYNDTYIITKVWDHVTTWCPEPTTLYFNNRTYVLPEPTTFIIEDCPCTQVYTTKYKDGYKPTGYVAPPVQTDDGHGNPGYGTYQQYPGGDKGGKPDQPAHTGAPNVPGGGDDKSGNPGYGTYEKYPGGGDKAGVPGPTAPGPYGTGKPAPTHVVVAGAEKRAVAGLAVVAGVVAAIAL